MFMSSDSCHKKMLLESLNILLMAHLYCQTCPLVFGNDTELLSTNLQIKYATVSF